MKNSSTSDLLVSLLLIILLVLLLNPFGTWMFTMFHMTLLVVTLIVYGIFLVFLWKGSPKDEREAQHQSIAGRAAFLVGSIFLLGGIVYQAFWGQTIDHWLIIAFTGMVLAKIIALGYGRKNL